MATGTVSVDAKLKDERGNLVTMGRVKLGGNATINPQDLEMRVVKAITFNPWPGRDTMVAGSIGSLASKDYFRQFYVMQGSIGSLEILDAATGAASPVGNYVRVRSYRVKTLGSITARADGPQGTARLYIGTQAGSIRASFWAIGR